MSVVIQQLPKGGLVKFREIDRSEEAILHYRQIGRRLISEPVEDSIPNFFEEGPHSRAELVLRGGSPSWTGEATYSAHSLTETSWGSRFSGVKWHRESGNSPSCS